MEYDTHWIDELCEKVGPGKLTNGELSAHQKRQLRRGAERQTIGILETTAAEITNEK